MSQNARRLRGAIESRTGFHFGTYRPTEFDGPVWLVIAPPTRDRLLSIVIGRRGFYLGRIR